MGCDKTLGSCNLKSPGNQEGFAAPVLATDEFCIPSTLGYVIQLFCYHTLFDVQPDSDALKPARGNCSPSQRVDDINAFKPASVHLFRFRYIHRPVSYTHLTLPTNRE